MFRDLRHQQHWRAAIVGLLAGCIALLFEHALRFGEGYRDGLLERLHASGSSFAWIVPPLFACAIGMFAAWLTSRFAPNAAGSGIPHVKGVLMYVSEMKWKQLIPVKFIGGVLCIGAGFSLGREGPTVQMGAAVGKLLADLLHVPRKAAPRLMACGAGAGLAAAFHAPLAGFIFTIEELQREFSSLTYGMALIAAGVADIVTTSFAGSDNAFHASGFPPASLISFPVYVTLGALCGVFGTAFNKALLGMQEWTNEKLKMPIWARAGFIGIVVGMAVWWFPAITGGGHHVAEQILHGNFLAETSVRLLVLLFVGKFILTLLCYMAGVPGGIFAPMLVMGAALGLLVGLTGSAVIPVMAPIPQSFAAIGMAALFSAVVRAPLTGIVLVIEMTGDFKQLLPLLVASMIAYLISERLGARPIYDALLAIDLQRKQPDIPAHREPILLEFVVEEESEMDGKLLKDLPLPERCLIVTIARHGHDVHPSGATELQRGDHVTAVVSGASGSHAIAQVLALSKV